MRERVAVFAFSDARYDSRTLNICRTLAGTVEVALWNLGSVPSPLPSWQWHTLRNKRRGRMLWRWVLFVATLVRHAWRWRADLIWAADVYCLLPAVLLGWRWKAAVVYDSRELYSSLGSLARRPLAQRILAGYERWLVRWVDRVVVSAPRDADEVQRLLALRQRPVVVLNVPFYAEPARTDRLRQHCGIRHTELVLLYQGAVQEGRGLDRAVEVLRFLPEAHLCVLGDGPFAGKVTELAEQLGVHHRVHVLGAVPYDELLEWTASADVGWCWIEPISHSYALALPNKLFEYAMARIPVVATDLPAIADVLAQFPFGVCLPVDTPAEKLAEAVRHVQAHAAQYRAAADAAARQWCYERQQPIITELVASLIRQRTGCSKETVRAQKYQAAPEQKSK
ncbi:MAG: glycosyltransferase [Bacteroidota bacterium]|nr:glycosyltransferase [Chlorobiota bacterium]MDW8075788.1 glycosyltransferase [Bacteroidota bacterium]